MGTSTMVTVNPVALARGYHPVSEEWHTRERLDGAIGGALALFVSGAAALAPVGAGIAYELTAGYGAVFAGLAAISVLAALAMLGMWRWE